MAHVQHGSGRRVASSTEFVRLLLAIAVAIALMLAANAVFGLTGTGPSLEIAPDPAGLTIPF
ncbi:MAG TPA: hypothetical protein VFO78_01280 [Candidatus Limnocylindrales bacterium]|nr:hypothetical protein [Candidatus Limnocylindrales bacterium]